MEIDIIEPKKKKAFEGDCYSCGKKGHLARDCWRPTQMRRSGKPKGTNHESLSWIGCYNHDCLTHRSKKERVGCYPTWLHQIATMVEENSREEPDMWEDSNLPTISKCEEADAHWGRDLASEATRGEDRPDTGLEEIEPQSSQSPPRDQSVLRKKGWKAKSPQPIFGTVPTCFKKL